MIEACIDELVKRGAVDWITVWDVLDVARHIGHAKSTEDLRTVSLEVIRQGTRAGLVDVGEIKDGAFKSWRLEPDVAVERIAQFWSRTHDPRDMIGDWWLNNTAAGDQRAQDRSLGETSLPG